MSIARALIILGALLFAAQVSASESSKGHDAYNSMDYETALTIWAPLAEAGDAESQYGLGMMYGNGFGVMMDDALAIKWYGAAADQGHAGAQNNLAIMHQNGWGVTPNEEEAVRYFTLAADQGVAEAMMALGRHYSMDFSEAYDPVQAYKWFSLGALMDSLDAQGKLVVAEDSMTPDQVAEGNALVAAWSNRHSEILAQQ